MGWTATTTPIVKLADIKAIFDDHAKGGKWEIFQSWYKSNFRGAGDPEYQLGDLLEACMLNATLAQQLFPTQTIDLKRVRRWRAQLRKAYESLSPDRRLEVENAIGVAVDQGKYIKFDPQSNQRQFESYADPAATPVVIEVRHRGNA